MSANPTRTNPVSFPGSMVIFLPLYWTNLGNTNKVRPYYVACELGEDGVNRLVEGKTGNIHYRESASLRLAEKIEAMIGRDYVLSDWEVEFEEDGTAIWPSSVLTDKAGKPVLDKEGNPKIHTAVGWFVENHSSRTGNGATSNWRLSSDEEIAKAERQRAARAKYANRLASRDAAPVAAPVEAAPVVAAPVVVDRDALKAELLAEIAAEAAAKLAAEEAEAARLAAETEAKAEMTQMRADMAALTGQVQVLMAALTEANAPVAKTAKK